MNPNDIPSTSEQRNDLTGIWEDPETEENPENSEVVEEPRNVRRSPMRPSESLDGARLEGILKRKRSCLLKTVSWSETVSEYTLPPVARPKPMSEGDYVERNVNPTDPPPRRPHPARCHLLKQVTNEEENVVGEKNESTNGNKEVAGNSKKGESSRENDRPLTVEDLPLDEDPDEFKLLGVYKSGLCTVGFAPVKKKKLMFVTLSERALELHESEKTYRSGKAAKHIVDLSISFNVHSEHFDAKMGKCLCLMGPDETICMIPEGGILTIEGWRRAIVRAIHDARRKKMDRTPRPEDIFDAVYDIRVVMSMKNIGKYVETRKEKGFTNICTAFKEFLGQKSDLRIEPTTFGLPPAGFPPFRSSNFFIIDRSTVSFYGFTNNYFYIRIGKGSAYRGFEILFMVESNEVCREIYARLKFLINRDLEKRRLDALKKPDPTLIFSDLHGMESLSVPSPLNHRNKLSLDSPVMTAKDRRLLLGRCALSFASIEKDDYAPSSPFANYNRPRGSLGNFQIDHLSRPRVPMPSTAPPCKLEPGFKEALLDYYPHLRKKNSTQSECGEVVVPEQERKLSEIRPRRTTAHQLKAAETESKEETPEPAKPTLPPLKLNANKPSGEFLLSLQREKEQAEEARRNGFDGKTQNPDGSLKEVKKDFLDTICPQPKPQEPEEASYARIVNSDTYTLMGPGEWGKLDDIMKDDQSDSGDSCYSSKRSSMCRHTKPHLSHLGCQLPSRAQSFGGNHHLKGINPNRIPPTVNLPDVERKTSAATGEASSNLKPPQEDLRKRAFSLGSRNFFNLLGFNEFRRLVSKRHRTSSPNHASTSKISLNSGNASPLSGSVNCLTSVDNLNSGRSGSSGSGRNSPAMNLTESNPGLCTPKKKTTADLISIDFANLDRKDSKLEMMRRYPFGGAPPGRPVRDLFTEINEKEEEERKARERKAIEYKKREEEENRLLAEKKREEERRAKEKKDKKREEKEMKEFRPKADSGIADCTPSSSFSGKQGEKKNDSSEYVYADQEGMKFLAGIRKKKKETQERKNSLSGSLKTTNSVTDIKSSQVIEHKITVKMVERQMSAIDLNRRSSLCAEMNRKSSVCAAIVEEKEEQSECESRGEPSAPSVPVPSPTRKTSTPSSLSLSSFKRFKLFSFRK